MNNLTGASTTAAVTDVIELGTFNLADGTSQKNSSSSHGRTGSILVFGKVHPLDYGSQGGNVAYLDGSVRWVPQDMMMLYAASSGGAVIGFWPPPFGARPGA
jgi:prepilin-type processing-associated H-X9-DG protein